MINKKFNKWLTENKQTPKQIAYFLDISQAMISQLKSGGKIPSLKLARKIEIFTQDAVPMESWIE